MTKSGVTMTVLVALFFGGTWWGFNLLTAGSDSPEAPAPTCQNTTIAAGEDVTPNFVRVNVYNAGVQSGLANRVHLSLQRTGFLAGDVGNSPEKVDVNTVTILTDDKESADVKLVAQQFKGKVAYKAPTTSLAEGVTIVVGNDFEGLKKEAPRSVTTEEDLTVCIFVDPATQVEQP